MKKNTSLFWLVLVLSVMTLLLAACGAPASDGGEEEPAPQAEEAEEEPAEEPAVPEGGTLSAGVLLDPALATDEDSQMVNALIYDTLVTGGGADPGLAARWTISDDGLDYILFLRADATFHDGSPVTADAVVANFNRWFDPDDSLHGSGDFAAWVDAFEGFKGETNDDGTAKSTFDGIEKVANLTVLVHLSRQDDDFLANLSNPAFSIVNPVALETAGDSYGTSADDVIGSGAYSVSDWTDGSLVLAPNGAYWGDVPGNAVEYALE